VLARYLFGDISSQARCVGLGYGVMLDEQLLFRNEQVRRWPAGATRVATRDGDPHSRRTVPWLCLQVVSLAEWMVHDSASRTDILGAVVPEYQDLCGHSIGISTAGQTSPVSAADISIQNHDGGPARSRVPEPLLSPAGQETAATRTETLWQMRALDTVGTAPRVWTAPDFKSLAAPRTEDAGANLPAG